MRPRISLEDASEIASRLYDLSGALQELPSYSDQNFRIDCGDQQYVLKIANAEEPAAVLEFQQEALQHVARYAPQLQIPTVIQASDGASLHSMPIGEMGRKHLVWLVSYLPGRFISGVPAHTPRLLKNVGAFMGKLDLALSTFQHPAMHRKLQWDLKNAAQLTGFFRHIKDSKKRGLVAHFLERFEIQISPRFSTLRSSVIHNDANDNNLLVDDKKADPQISGIIDFGDMVHSFTVCELAIAIAYMILGREDILPAAVHVLQGYHHCYPLTEAELGTLFDMICIRLCTSVCMSARERSLAPDNAYLAISEKPAWDTLERLLDISPDLALEAFRAGIE